MKILTTSFLTCAVKACKSSPLSFPLHYKDAELEQSDIAYNPQFLINILPRIDWDAVRVTAAEVSKTNFTFCYILPRQAREEFTLTSSKQLGFTVPDEKPEPTLPPADASSTTTSTSDVGDEKMLRELHTLLLETEVKEGKLVCGNCGHEYKIKEGIANFLLPSHLGE